jgi:hypothetical protein
MGFMRDDLPAPRVHTPPHATPLEGAERTAELLRHIFSQMGGQKISLKDAITGEHTSAGRCHPYRQALYKDVRIKAESGKPPEGPILTFTLEPESFHKQKPAYFEEFRDLPRELSVPGMVTILGKRLENDEHPNMPIVSFSLSHVDSEELHHKISMLADKVDKIARSRGQWRIGDLGSRREII